MAAAFPDEENIGSVEARRNDQGLHQCQVFECGSDKGESQQAWDTCNFKDNHDQGHKDFIPVMEFSEENLPSRFQDRALVGLIRVIASLTALVRVGHVSASRPDGYAFARCKGQDFPFTGSGWVYEVSRKEGPCPCQQCSSGLLPRFQWWKIAVFTACHVVYDKREAESTTVDLFYDEENSKVATLYGYDVEDNNQVDDVCLLQCALHDKDLVETLLASIERYDHLKWDVPESLMSTLCVVISHPHGQPKKISVGEIYGMATYNPERSLLSEYMYTYTAATCDGSSGAPVISAVSKKKLGSKGVWPGAGPHSWRCVGTERALNQCAPGIFYVGAELLNKTMRQDRLKNLKTATEHADISFMLVGKTGVGKSSLGNAILKQKMFVTDPGTTSVTRDISFATSEFKGRMLKVVDMMGLQDTRMTMAASVKHFLRQVEEVISVTAGSHQVFLLVLRFGTRFTQEDMDTVQLFKSALGPEFLRQNCIVAMTCGDHFVGEMEPEFTFEDWCRVQRGYFKVLLDECEHRVLLFDNWTREEATCNAQIEKLLKMVGELQAKGHSYTDRDFALSQPARERISVELIEPEVREKVFQEEKHILQNLEEKKSDLQQLKILFMRSESLMRYVRGRDRDSGVLLHLMERVSALRQTVEEAVQSLSSLRALRQRMLETERDVHSEVQAVRQEFEEHLALRHTIYMQRERWLWNLRFLDFGSKR